MRFLDNAKKNKKDEFYTMYSDIETEMQHYDFAGKVIYCNCDDGLKSNFFKYFNDNFKKLKIKKLICTGFSCSGIFDNAFIVENENVIVRKVIKTGDFRNNIDYLQEADVIVTNPPFSLFREYIEMMIKSGKNFLILGNVIASGYKEIFKYIMDNKLWFGYKFNGKAMCFAVPEWYDTKGSISGTLETGEKYVAVGGTCWFTNIDIPKKHIKINLTEKFDDKKYFKYDNYDAINVDKIKEIPSDYDGIMGVPITFLNRYNSEQFKIIGFRYGEDGKDLRYTKDGKKKYPFYRVLIKKIA